MTTIAHLIKSFTLWEFVKAHWLTWQYLFKTVMLLTAMTASASHAGETAKQSAQVDFDFMCEMQLPTKRMAKLGGHVSYATSSAQSNDIGNIQFSEDTTPQKLGGPTVTIGNAAAGLVLGIQQSGDITRSFVLDARPGGNASLLVAEGAIGRKMVALGYCDISGLKETK